MVGGYYFGRVPADARATQAQEQANAAAAQAEQVGTQAQLIAGEVGKVLDKVAPGAAAARGAAGQPMDASVTADLQQIRNKLRTLSNHGTRGR